MKHRIDPLVDCVFKALLGAEKNKNLLIHFLNAILEPSREKRIKEVEILNPYNEKEFLNDKLSVVDVKAKDSRGQFYQIEVQLLIHSSLTERMLYTWGKIYSAQLTEGIRYTELRPLVSIWILAGTLFQEARFFHHHFQAVDPQEGLVLSDHFSIHLLELKKAKIKEVHTEKERWARFFKEGKSLNDATLPNR